MAGLADYARWAGIAAAGLTAFWVAAQWSSDTRSRAAVDSPPRASGAASSALTAAAATAASSPGASTAAPDGSLTTDRSRSIPRSEGELFTAQPWDVPTAAAAAPVPVPAPVAAPAPPVAQVVAGPPALPFTFVGMLEQGAGKPAAFLAKGEQLIVASSGDVLDNKTYRVDRLSPTEIVMTYLPLNIQQTLRIPEVSP